MFLFKCPIVIAVDVDHGFKIFDGTIYSNKPNMDQYNIQTLKIIYTSALWPNKSDWSVVPDPKVISSLASDFEESELNVLCLDIEQWDVRGENKKNNLDKYKSTINAFKRHLKDAQIGYYGLAPERNYWASMENSSHKKNREWKKNNKMLADFAALNLDVVFPSLYTFYTNQNDWKKFAIEHIKEAKKYGKPVYVFLWPLYHESNSFRKHDYIGDSYWRLQLETAYKYADGVVIWGGWDFENKRPMMWDESAEWWVETKKMIKNIKNK